MYMCACACICTQDFSKHQLANLFSYLNRYYRTMLISHIYLYSVHWIDCIMTIFAMLTISKCYQLSNHVWHEKVLAFHPQRKCVLKLLVLPSAVTTTMYMLEKKKPNNYICHSFSFIYQRHVKKLLSFGCKTVLIWPSAKTSQKYPHLFRCFLFKCFQLNNESQRLMMHLLIRTNSIHFHF